MAWRGWYVLLYTKPFFEGQIWIMNIQMAGVLIEADDEVGERQGAVRDSRVMLHPPKKPNHRTQKRCISQAPSIPKKSNHHQAFRIHKTLSILKNYQKQQIMPSLSSRAKNVDHV